MSKDKCVFTCKDCGEEMQIIGDVDPIDLDDMTQQWKEQHEDCGNSALLAAWRKTIEASRFVRVDRDASKIPGMPARPSWSEPEIDELTADGQGRFRSDTAMVPLYNLLAVARGRDLEYSAMTARAILDDTNHRMVELGWIRVFNETDTRRGSFYLDVDTAREYARILLAAADLAESE